MPTLNEQHKLYIVQEHACFSMLEDIKAGMQAEFNLQDVLTAVDGNMWDIYG